MIMYSLIEYSQNCSKSSRNLWQYYNHNPNGNMLYSESFNTKGKITARTPAAVNTIDVKKPVSLKY